MNKSKQAEITPDKFRRTALRFAGAVEAAHMDHPDFRVEGKIFATLGYPDEGFGMVKLTPEQQRSFIEKAPGVFVPCSGAWGRSGATSVHLASVTADILHAALDAAWRNVVAKAKKKDA